MGELIGSSTPNIQPSWIGNALPANWWLQQTPQHLLGHSTAAPASPVHQVEEEVPSESRQQKRTSHKLSVWTRGHKAGGMSWDWVLPNPVLRGT